MLKARTVFIKIELVGNTARELDDKVDDVMVNDLKWTRQVEARIGDNCVQRDLPAAMYIGTYAKAMQDLAIGIKERPLPIWSNPVVLVMCTGNDWAMADNT